MHKQLFIFINNKNKKGKSLVRTEIHEPSYEERPRHY